MRCRRLLALPFATLVAVAGCSDGHGVAPRAVTTAPAVSGPAAAPAAATPATPAPSPTPSATPVDTSPDAVAVPTCLGPEVRPSWWTYFCADAGYQLDLTWDSWNAQAGRAHGEVRMTTGDHRGWSGRMRAVFDRPRQAKDGRWLFSRVVVTFADGSGPAGEAPQTFDAWELWESYEWDLEHREAYDPCPEPTSCATMTGEE